MSLPDLYRLQPGEEQSLGRAVASLGTGQILPVVVVSSGYLLFLENWIAHLARAGIKRFLIVAMDAMIEASLEGRGFVVARANFDGSPGDFWLRRMLIWKHLVDIGVNIIQSDIDAIWIRNPIREWFHEERFDLVCSQGTLHPIDAVERWGFVLCTGLMMLRSCPATIRFMEGFAQEALLVRQTDDQLVMNTLLCKHGLEWDKNCHEPRVIHFDGHNFEIYQSVLAGVCRDTGLRVGLLPHHAFPRLPQSNTTPYVKHLLRPEDDERRIDELREAGCWLLPDNEATPA